MQFNLLKYQKYQKTFKLCLLHLPISIGTPITIGVLYRPPNGNIDKALSELATILDDLPQHSYVAGDFNIDLHQSNNKYTFQSLKI